MKNPKMSQIRAAHKAGEHSPHRGPGCPVCEREIKAIEEAHMAGIGRHAKFAERHCAWCEEEQEVARKAGISVAEYLRRSEAQSVRGLAAAASANPGGKGPRIWESREAVVDRYTLITPDGSVYGFNEQPFHPQGFGQFAGDFGNTLSSTRHLGKRVKLEDLSKDAQRFVRERMNGGNPRSGRVPPFGSRSQRRAALASVEVSGMGRRPSRRGTPRLRRERDNPTAGGLIGGAVLVAGAIWGIRWLSRR